MVAENTPDPNYVPERPADTFAGAEGSVERQKQALVQLLAEQGTYGAQQLKNRQQAANGLSINAQAATPAEAPMNANTKALYDVFGRDSEQSLQQHNQEQARILAANKAYMDQAGAAMPLDRSANEAYTTALKMGYEERQRARQAEIEQQQLANQRAAASAYASSASAKPSYYDQQKEKRDADTQLLLEQLKGQAPMDRKWSDIQTAGIQGNPNDTDMVSRSFGFNGDPEQYGGLTGNQAKAAKRLVADVVQEAQSTGASFREVVNAAMSAARNPTTAAEYGFKGQSFVDHVLETYLATYAGQWGLSPADLGFKTFTGQGAAPLTLRS